MMSRLLPKLRFDGFSGEWEENTLGKVVKFLDGQRKPIKESDRANMQGEYPYYGASGIIDYVNGYIFDEDLILLGEDGENIVSRNSPLVFKVSGKSWINNHAHVLKPIKPNDLDFLVQYMETLSYLKYNSGGAQPKLNQAVCKTIPLILPKPPEQQKIANCLSSLDALIEAQTKKVEALKKHKKGLMQGLFPAEGEKEPKLRFEGFGGEWVKSSLENYCSITTGRLDANAMVENGEYRFYTCAKDYYRIDKFEFDTDALLISGNGANVGYIHHYNGKFNAYQRTYVLDQFKVKIHFLKYYLEKNLRKRILTEKKDGNTPYIVMSTLTEMSILLPTLPEQQKIANCLSSLDSLLEAQNKKVEALKTHKKGLMQGLFVSGEVGV